MAVNVLSLCHVREISPGTHTFFPTYTCPVYCWRSVQLLDFDLLGNLIHASQPIRTTFTGQWFASGFLQTPPHGDALAIGCTLPTAGRVRDFHPLERAPAGHTGTLQTSLLVSSGIALAFSLIMNAYSARYHYPISINSSNAALFSSCLLMTVLYLALTGWAFRRKAKLEEKQILYRQLQDYIHSLEEYNTSLRIYRHDYTNLLLAARLYVEQKDWEKLEKFHREILLPFYEKYLHEGDEK